MTVFVRQIYGVFYKDVLSELREGHHFLSVILFALLVILLFSFALSVDPELMRRMTPGLFWLSVLFTTILVLQDSFRRESEDRQWDGLLLLGIDPRALYLGKLLSHLAFVGILQAVLGMAMVVLFDLSPSPSLILVLFLGSVGIATLGTFYAGLTASLKEGAVLLPLLLFPMMVPVLLASVHATEFALVGDLFGQRTAWLKLLIVFDTVFLLGSLLCADFLFEGG